MLYSYDSELYLFVKYQGSFEYLKGIIYPRNVIRQDTHLVLGIYY